MNGIEMAKETYTKALGITGLSPLLHSHKLPLLNRLWIGFTLLITLPLMFILTLISFIIDTSMSGKFLSLMSVVAEALLLFKSCYFIYNINRMRGNMLQFETFNSVRFLGQFASDFLADKSKSIMRMQNNYNVAVLITFIAWGSAPILFSPESLFASRNVDKMVKALYITYPFKTDYFPMIQLIYLMETIMTMSSLIHFSGLNLFFFTTLRFITVQFQLLNKSLQGIHGTESISMKEFVIDHQKLLRICRQVKDVLHPVLTMQILISIVTVCVIILEMNLEAEDLKEVYENTLKMKILHYVRFMASANVMLLELLLYCWLSIELQNSCESVREGLYFSPWYENLSTLPYKDYIIINCRTLRPFNLRALFIINIELATFIDVVKASYSYYTMLKEMKH